MMFELSGDHLAAVERQRRVIFNYDITFNIHTRFEQFNDVGKFIDELFTFMDEDGSQVDAIWWNWGEGNQAPYPSELMPLYDAPLYRQWADEGFDIVAAVNEATKRRGLECFYSFRMNGADNDLSTVATIPAKETHPDWLFHPPWSEQGVWNYAIPEVRDMQLAKLRDAAQRWDIDGIELDFGRGIAFAAGEQWINRDHLTQFMRDVRDMAQQRAEQRGRPMLLAARVGDTLLESHMDGLDVEAWIDEALVDLLVLGIRNLNVDVATYRRLTRGTPIKLYPALDDHHASDGYCYPPIEVFRGAFANWYDQGADGIQTFNFCYAPDAMGPADLHRQAMHEMGDPAMLAPLDKTFVINRRGGGHGPTVIPNPEDWHTPRHMFANSCSLSQLPAELDNQGKVDTLLTLYVCDDLIDDGVQSLSLRILLNDPTTDSLPDGHKIEKAAIRVWRERDFFYNSPPVKGIDDRFEMRVNNVLLPKPIVVEGWLVFSDLDPMACAVGDNLLGLRVQNRRTEARVPILVERVELHVKYA